MTSSSLASSVTLDKKSNQMTFKLGERELLVLNERFVFLLFFFCFCFFFCLFVCLFVCLNRGRDKRDKSLLFFLFFFPQWIVVF